MTKSDLLGAVAKACLGQVMIKGDPTLGCARAVNKIAKISFGKEVGGGASTNKMFDVLSVDKRFKDRTKPQTGLIIISPTGYGTGNGHVGIMLDENRIASNDSKTGKWLANYTWDSWLKKFEARKFPVFLYEWKF